MTSNSSPVMPLIIRSVPFSLNPMVSKSFLMFASGSELNVVPLIYLPASAPAFPPMTSMRWLTVILLGMECGENMMSGVIPDTVNGMSACGTIIPTTPFCP